MDSVLAFTSINDTLPNQTIRNLVDKLTPVKQGRIREYLTVLCV